MVTLPLCTVRCREPGVPVADGAVDVSVTYRSVGSWAMADGSQIEVGNAQATLELHRVRDTTIAQLGNITNNASLYAHRLNNGRFSVRPFY